MDDILNAKDSGPEAEECKLCGYVLAGIGIGIGVVFLYMSFDILSGGALTKMLGLGVVRGTADEETVD